MKRLLLIVPIVLLLLVGLYFVPPVNETLAWRVDELVLMVKYKLNPPGQVVFVPQTLVTPVAQNELQPPSVATATQSSIQPSPTAVVTNTPMPTAAPTQVAVPLPAKFSLDGVTHTTQHGRLNYCAPANLTMALTYWDWDGERNEVGAAIKPDERDKNVMPYEMADYVDTQTDLKAIVRVGGDIETLKQFISSGYPVVVEKGTYLRDLSGINSWMGHYQVLTGYDEENQIFIAQDSYVGPDWEVPNETLIEGWRAFNYIYMVVYPPEQEEEVMGLLGVDADETVNFQNAALKASNEVYGLTGIDQYFAWFNRGSSLVRLQDYAGGSAAFDEAFALYPSIPENERPWRTLWYRTEPYFGYFYSGRYYDVLYLADSTLEAMQSDKALEESFYWRGMAKAALGDTAGAVEDFRSSLEFHPGFEPAIYQLQQLGYEP